MRRRRWINWERCIFPNYCCDLFWSIPIPYKFVLKIENRKLFLKVSTYNNVCSNTFHLRIKIASTLIPYIESICYCSFYPLPMSSTLSIISIKSTSAFLPWNLSRKIRHLKWLRSIYINRLSSANTPCRPPSFSLAVSDPFQFPAGGSQTTADFFFSPFYHRGTVFGRDLFKELKLRWLVDR